MTDDYTEDYSIRDIEIDNAIYEIHANPLMYKEGPEFWIRKHEEGSTEEMHNRAIHRSRLEKERVSARKLFQITPHNNFIRNQITTIKKRLWKKKQQQRIDITLTAAAHT